MSVGIGFGLGIKRERPRAAPPAPPTFTGKALGGFTGSNKIDSAANQLVDFRPGRTLWLVMQATGAPAATENVAGCNRGNFAASTAGWWITRQITTGRFFLLAATAHSLGLFTPPAHGILVICIVWRASDNAVLASVNGGTLVNYGTLVSSAAVDASCKTYVGTDNGSFAVPAMSTARLLAMALWSTEATNAQAIAGTYTAGDRFALPVAVRSPAVVDVSAARDWNGIASTITTLGSSPVTLNVTGAPTLTNVAEQRVPITEAMIWDSQLAQVRTDGNGVGYRIRAPYARVRLTTDALAISAEIYSTIYDYTSPSYRANSEVGVYTGGAYVTTCPAAIGSTPHMVNANPGAGTGKAVDLWEGEQILNGQGPESYGTFILALRVPVYLEDGVTSSSTSIRMPTPVQHRLVLVGDSILCGFFTTILSRDGQTALLRADYPSSGTGGVTCRATAGSSIENVVRAGVALAAQIIVAECNGTVDNTVWLADGTNDYGFVTLESAATFGARYAALLDAIHARAPAVRIFCQTPIQRIAPASEAANSTGNTLGAYRAAITAAVATRTSFCTLVDGAAGAIVSNANLYQGIHVVNAGAVQHKAAIKTAVGY